MFSKDIESMPRAQMRALQLERLKFIVNYAYDNVDMYRQKFDEIGLLPKHIQTLSDIEKIPFTTKDDLRDNYPFKLFARPMREIIRLHASSGTTGKPIVAGYTKTDLDTWATAVARVVVMAGLTEDDIVQISFGYGLFTGGFGLHQGIEKVGAAILPISSGNTERQLMLMEDFGSTALVATPSYAMYLAETAKKKGITDKLKLKLGLFGAEASTNEMHAALQNILQVFPTENYGLTEIIGPGVSGECRQKCGMHINEDMFYPEIYDFDNDKSLNEGGEGELLLTTLTKEAMPILRYRTKDITSLDFSPCACGRRLVRMGRIKGRTDDMLIIRGVNVFPSQIESVLMGIERLGKHYEIYVRRENFLDTLEVAVEVTDESLLSDFSKLENLSNNIRGELRKVLQLDIKVKLVEPFSLKRTEGKVKRVYDLRNT